MLLTGWLLVLLFCIPVLFPQATFFSLYHTRDGVSYQDRGWAVPEFSPWERESQQAQFPKAGPASTGEHHGCKMVSYVHRLRIQVLGQDK